MDMGMWVWVRGIGEMTYSIRKHIHSEWVEDEKGTDEGRDDRGRREGMGE